MKMFYFKRYIHHANINNEVTILDELSDRYILLSENQTKMLQDYMLCGEVNDLGEMMTEAGYLSHSPGVSLSPSYNPPEGVGLLQWSSNVEKAYNPSVLKYGPEALIRLRTIRKRLRVNGLHGCLQNCREKLKNVHRVEEPTNKTILLAENLSQSINLAAPFLNGKIKCLEFSLTLFDMLISRGITPSLYIGFQRYDFLSHAWVEINGYVISDVQSLKNRLTTIISVTI